MSLLSEFRAFAMRGNVIDLAVGVVIGTAFGKITTSLVDNVIMPPLGVLISGVDFSEIGVTLVAAQGDKPAVVWALGAFVQTCLNFLIIAAAVFALVRVINRLVPKEAPAVAEPALTTDQKLLVEIRDALKAGRAAGKTPAKR